MSRIKVLEVVDAGESGAAAQVNAICSGLDPERFEVSRIELSPVMSLRRLARLIAAERPAVLHAHAPRAGRLARPAARLAGVRRIFYTPHGYGFLKRDRPLAARVMDRLVERGAARVGETIAASSLEAEFARKLAGHRRVHLVRDAYLGGFPEAVAHDGLVVGSAGRMTRDNEPHAWVLLAQRLTDSRNGVSCAWLGGGGEEAKARTDLTNMNLAAKVSVTGELDQNAARGKLRALDLFVRYAQGGAGSVLDAMACGLPVVASNVPAHRELVVDGVTGFLVAGEVELLERCQQLLDDEGLRRRLGDAGRARVRAEFSRERMLAELSRLYSA